MLEKYAKEQGFTNLAHYTDDGYSGRNYLEVGFYTEILFREKGVRFIAISNGVDSSHSESNEFAPFLNIMNEWYVRDTSRKIKSVLRNKGMEGKHLTSNAIYGYKKDPEDALRNKILIIFILTGQIIYFSKHFKSQLHEDFHIIFCSLSV